MATKSLTFNKIEGITSGSSFTVNALGNDKTVTATVYFSPLNLYADISKVTPKIGSVTVGGQNWISTEIIKITYEFGIVTSNGYFSSYSDIFPSSSHQVSEKNGTVPSSVSLSSNRAENAPYFYGDNVSYFAYKIKIESTQDLVGCKVVMSDFQLSVDYTVRTYTISAICEPLEGGTVSGGGTYEHNSTATLTAIPASGYKFVRWSGGLTTPSMNVKVTANMTLTAIFEPVYVTYDTIFSFKKWKDIGIVSSNSIVSNISDTGFTLTSNNGVSEGTASSPYFSVEPGEPYRIDIDISGNNWDVYIFFCDIDGNWIDFEDGPTNRFSSNTNWGNTFTAPNKAEVVKAFIRIDANGANNTVTYDNFRIFSSNYDYMSDSVSAIERTDAILWSMPTPTRNGYKFLGWYTQFNGGGSKYTSSSTFPTTDLVLYSHWELQQKYTITFKNWDGTELESKEWNQGEIPSYNGIPTRPADNYHIYEFIGWSPTITPVSNSATYIAQFNPIERKYTIIIDPNGGIYNNSSANTIISEKYQSVISINNPQKENSFFTHWNLSRVSPLKTIQTANGYTDYSGTNASTKFSRNLSQDGTYTNYKWYDLNATADTWNYLSFNTYSVAENETITITGYIRVNGTAAAQLNFYHGEKINDYANNKFNVKNTNNDWKKFSFSRTFTTAVDTAVFQIYTSNLVNLTGEINFDLKEIQIIRENGTILPTVIQVNNGDLSLTANYKKLMYTVTFKDWNGDILSTQSIKYHNSATAPSNPSRPYDDLYHYSFKSWDKSFTDIISDIIITATYNSISHNYTNPTLTSKGRNSTCSCGKILSEIAYDVGLDNIFSLSSWINSSSSGIDRGKVNYNVHNNIISTTSFTKEEADAWIAAGSNRTEAQALDCYTRYANSSSYFNLLVNGNTQYTVSFKVDNNYAQCFVFFYNDNGSCSPAHYNLENGGNLVTGENKRIFTTPSDCTKVQIRFGSTGVYNTTTTFSNIRICKSSMADIENTSYRKVFFLNDAIGELNTPNRTLHSFLGWYTEESGGIQVTSSTKFTKSEFIYSKWKKNQMKFKSVKIYYPTEVDVVSSINSLVSGKEAQIVVQIGLE